MKQFTMKKISLLLGLLLIITPLVFPFSVHAEDNVDFYMKNKDKFNEDGTLIEQEDEQKNQDSTTIKEDKKAGKTGTSAWDYIRTLFALAFVIGLLYALLKFVNRRNRLYDKNRYMKNMGGISLGQQKSIQLVAVGNTYYLIGVGEDIRLLKEITSEEEIQALLEHYEEVDISQATGLLEQFLTKIPKVKQKNSSLEEKNTDFSKLFHTRLDEIKEDRKRHMDKLTEKERNPND